MTRKHFEAVAAKFADMLDTSSLISHDSNFIAGQARGILDSAEAMADTFATFNPNFDRVRFMTACGF